MHDLVDEQQAFPLDVDLTGATLQGHQANDVLAAAAEPLGHGVGHEAEGLDHGLHPLARLRLDQAGLAHDPGDRGGGNSRHPRDIVNRRHRRSSSHYETAYIRCSLVTLNAYVSGVNSEAQTEGGPGARHRSRKVS